MKRIVLAVAGAVLAVGVTTAMANCGSCGTEGGGKHDGGTCGGGTNAAMRAACTNMLAQLDLTAEQKAKIAELRKSCTGKCTAEQKTACRKAMHEILTPEQREKMKAMCEKRGMKCPMTAAVQPQAEEKAKAEAKEGAEAPCCPMSGGQSAR
jgi:Spy/CpxP family protein refolding chaperone